jgi:type VII secretion protein EccB
MRETDPSQSPLRRGVGAIFGGVMLAVLVAAGFGIYGLVTKVGGDDWRQHGSVIVERETGASYIYLNGTLYPTLNLASAMLAAPVPSTIHRVASKSLSDVPRGGTIGIPGAPDSLPSADRAIALPWTVCTRTDTSGNVDVVSADLAIGVGATGGDRLTDNGLLVRDTGPGLPYLVYQGRRHLIASDAIINAAFGGAETVNVDPAWINALPAGGDIAPIPVERRGEHSAAIDGLRNGDVVAHQTPSGEQKYLVLDDGVYPIYGLQWAVIVAGAPAGEQIEPIPINPQLASRRSDSLPPPSDLDPPPDPPALARVGDTDTICATSAGATGAPSSILTPPTITVGSTVDGIDRGIRTKGVSADGAPLADRVLLPGGRVAIVHAAAVVQNEPRELLTGSYLVVTDLGIAYPVPDAGVLPLLGYSTGIAVDVPSPLVKLIPSGPALDTGEAIRNMVLPGA